MLKLQLFFNELPQSQPRFQFGGIRSLVYPSANGKKPVASIPVQAFTTLLNSSVFTMSIDIHRSTPLFANSLPLIESLTPWQRLSSILWRLAFWFCRLTLNPL